MGSQDWPCLPVGLEEIVPIMSEYLYTKGCLFLKESAVHSTQPYFCIFLNPVEVYNGIACQLHVDTESVTAN